MVSTQRAAPNPPRVSLEYVRCRARLSTELGAMSCCAGIGPVCTHVVLALGSAITFSTPLCGTRDHPLGKRWRPAYEGGPSARGCDWLAIVRDHPLGKRWRRVGTRSPTGKTVVPRPVLARRSQLQADRDSGFMATCWAWFAYPGRTRHWPLSSPRIAVPSSEVGCVGSMQKGAGQ